jgi:predicted dienelactone hydrolase
MWGLIMRPIVVRLALVLAALLSSRAATAANTCLQAPFSLDDQRALAALRTSTETACPCDAAATRGAYQRCARGAIDDAVGTGALRPGCRTTARRIARGAACGSDLVPCGKVRQTDLDYSCTLSRASSCAGGTKVTRTACAAETHCADVVDWSAGTCHDVRDLGPFAPGHRQVQYMKDSVVSPGTTRVLNTSIWYPAAPGSGPIDPATGGVTGAPVDPSAGPYPIVLFSHGSCGTPTQSRFLTPLLASYGFVVVAPPHPGNTIAEFPNCRSADAQRASLLERPQDMRFVLDQVLAAAVTPGSFLTGVLDVDRIAMTGHSFGGLTTYFVQSADPRIDVAVVMAPAALGSPRLTVPSLTILGNIDSVVNNEQSRAAYAASVSPKMLVEIEHAGHFSFSDFCFPSSDCNPPVTLSSAEAHDAALRFVLPFLMVHLAGDASWVPLLEPPAQPGFLYTSE